MSPFFLNIRIFIMGICLACIPTSSGLTQENQMDKKQRPVKVETAAVDFRKIENAIEAVGTSKASRSVDLMTVSNGVISSITFEDGQQVTEGAVLIKLDDDVQRADLAEAEAKLKEAKQSLLRSQSLQKKNAIAASMVDKIISEVEIARAERDRALRYLKDRTMLAPFAGRIGFSDIAVGAHLKANEPIAILDDLSKVEVEFSLPENLYGRVHLDTTVQASAAAFTGQVFKANIVSIDTRIDSISRSFKLRASIDNEQGYLPAGMFMHLTLVLDTSEVLSIPEEAVMVDGTQTHVFLVVRENQTVRKQSIKLGKRSFGWVEVISGLEKGDRVIIRGLQKVKSGSFISEND
jgi:membrane fusion protein (multidrug efflux system)